MSFLHVLRHMCNLHIKETEISQKRRKGIKNWNITYSVILSVLTNKTNFILGFSSPLRTYVPKYNFMTKLRGSDKKDLLDNLKTRRLVGVQSGYMHGIGEWAAEWPMAMRNCCLLGNCVSCRWFRWRVLILYNCWLIRVTRALDTTSGNARWFSY